MIISTAACMSLLHKSKLLLRTRVHIIPSSPLFHQHTSLFRSFTTIMNDGHDPNLEEIFDKKRALRTHIRKQLRDMTQPQRAQEDEVIQRFVLEAPWFKSASSLCAYVNCDALREVNTLKILSTILSDNAKDNFSKSRKKVYLPRIEDKNSNMRMLQISSYDDLFPNSMNILEPSERDLNGKQREDLMQANKPVDLFILPGLAFDKSGRRLGRSGGYYDMYLKRYLKVAKERNWELPLLVALSYSIQIVDKGAIGVTPDDIPVDALVCPAGVIFTHSVGNEI